MNVNEVIEELVESGFTLAELREITTQKWLETYYIVFRNYADECRLCECEETFDSIERLLQ